MRSGGSHAKGASFERLTCRRLSLWMTNGKRDDLFWRTAMSGGRATLQARKGVANLAQVGDVGAIDAEGERLSKLAVVECKFYADLDILGGIVHGRGRMFLFWEKLCDEAARVERAPVLIAKQNRLPTLLLTTHGGVLTMQFNAGRLAELSGWPQKPVLYLFDSVIDKPRASRGVVSR